MNLKCKRCKKEWEYTGDKKPNNNYPIFVACPVCKTSVKLEDTKNETN